jgi:hypothetical protein
MTWTYFINIMFHLYLEACFCRRWQNRTKWASGTHIGGLPDPPWAHQALPRWDDPCEASQKCLLALGSTLCFLSMAQDHVTWIHGPTCEANQHDKWSPSFIHTHLHVGTAYRNKREGPPTIGGSPTHLLGPPDALVGPGELHRLPACLHVAQMISTLDQWRFNDGLIQWLRWNEPWIADVAPPLPPPINRGSHPLSIHECKPTSSKWSVVSPLYHSSVV